MQPVKCHKTKNPTAPCAMNLDAQFSAFTLWTGAIPKVLLTG